MMTLREFLEEVNAREHYRIYQPNRDCLIFESYFKVHSPYRFDAKADEERSWFQHDYWDNNDFCDDVRDPNVEDDEETKIFLEKFGDYEVFSLECSSFQPVKIYKGSDGKLKFEYYNKTIDCFNVFIAPAKAL